ncbi:MAG: hypothetical protein ACXVCP_19180, partial [Bdellovibrio sp.]
MKSKIINLAVIVSVLSNFASAATFTTDHPAGRTGPGLDLDAYELFYSLYDQSIDLKSRELYVLGTDRTVPITFGAEKEGSSVKVLRVLSPSANLIVRALMSEPELGLLFIKGLLDGSILQTVVDKDGNAITLNVDGLRNLKAIDWSVFDSLKFDRNRRIWSDAHLYLDYMDKIPVLKSVFPGAPFSFLKPDVRNFLWEQKGTYRTSTEKNAGLFRDYDDWIPLYGESEKYIEKGHRELNNGWEVIFKPQKTYADF